MTGSAAPALPATSSGYRGAVSLPGEPETAAAAIEIRGSRLVLRALRPEEIEDQWQAMVNADPMAIAEP